MREPNYILNSDYNPKQVELWNEVVLACDGLSDKRTFAFGGAIRGGKTFGVLIVIDALCRQYPRSRWAIIRADLPRLLRTTVPSLEKITMGSRVCKWHRSVSDFKLTYTNGSSIHFLPESISKDPTMTRLLGFECNGVVLEQAEEISHKCFNMVLSRVGTWIIPKMPPKFIFMTFNPADGWFKELIHDKYLSGELPRQIKYIHALPTHNKAITAEQFEHWKQMPSDLYAQFVLSDWSALSKAGQWFKNFDQNKHVAAVTLQTLLPIYISIDWNFAKFCAIAYQRSPIAIGNNTFCHVLREFVLQNANIRHMAAEIKTAYPIHAKTKNIIVTGDKTGSKHDVGIDDTSATYIKMLQYELGLPDKNMLFGQIDYVSSLKNLDLRSSWSLCNDFLERQQNFKIDPLCKETIKDLKKAKHDQKKGNCNLYKTGASGEYDMGLSDCIRYMMHEVRKEKFINHLS